jgi:epoxide hydrolase 4
MMSSGTRLALMLGAGAVIVCTIIAALLRSGEERRRRIAGELPERTRRLVLELGARACVLDGEGVKLHVVEAGPEDGPLVVLLHGFPDSWMAWRHQLPFLAGLGFRVMAPDQRGYGLSDRPAALSAYRFDALVADVRALVRGTGRSRAVIVGHDWGGAVAWRFAMDHPELVEKLVILDAPHPVAFERELKTNLRQLSMSWYIAFFQLPALPEALLGYQPAFTSRFFFRKNAFVKDAYTDEELDFLACSQSQEGAWTAMIDWYRAAARLPPGPNAVIDRPTLLLWAEEDVSLGVGLTEGLEKWVPRMERVLVPRAGHFIPHEAKDEVNAQMAKFLGGGAAA